LPFQGDHEAAVLHAIIGEQPQPVARFNNKVSEDLQRIVSKALAKEKEERYQHIDDVLADLRREKKSLEYVETTQIPAEAVPAKPKKKLLPFLIPASIVFLMLLLLLIFKPFRVEVVPEKKAIAEENSLAIMYFENMVDPEDRDRIAQMITALLITDLSESQYLRVESQQRLYDILKLLGKEDLKVIDRTVASEVAKKAGVKWILTGNVFQIEPNMVLTTDISDATTGGILATQRITGEAGEDLFSVVDKLSAEIKDELSLPEAAKKELDRAVADVTTHSLEAYRYYLEGMAYYNKWYSTEAAKSFRKALEFDSTFAMAYYRLADLTWENESVVKAVEYSDKVSQKEKRYIKSLEARKSENYERAIAELQKIEERYPQEKEVFYQLGVCYREVGEYEEAIRQWNKAIEIDPLYKRAYGELAYFYDDIGDFDKSIWAINEYISIAPNEATPYDLRGALYALHGKMDQSIESYKKACEIKPGFSTSKLGHMYLFKRKYETAESCYQKLSSSAEKDSRSEGRTYLAYIPLYQAKLEEALGVLDDGIAADRMEKVEGWWNTDKYVLKATIYVQKKNLDLALRELEKCEEIWHRLFPDCGPSCLGYSAYYVQLLAENDDFEKAEEVASVLKKDAEEYWEEYSKAVKDVKEVGSVFMPWYWYSVGCIEFSKGNFEASAKYLTKAAEQETNPRSISYFRTHFMLARAYQELDRLGEAVSEFEKELVSNYGYGRSFWAIWAVKTHYYLGLAYENSGWNKKAIEQYEEFLDIWKDADPGIPEVEDAKERLEKLKAQS
jgi:tetratricopeptide (TPR) repeat protein